MQIQNVNILPFSSRNSAKPVLKVADAIKPKTELKQDDVEFNKRKGSVMRKALILSLVMLSGTIAYFRKLP